MLRYPCLVLDHDDTVVMSEATVHYPCFCQFLAQYRPDIVYPFEQYILDCNTMPFTELCTRRFHMTQEELHQEYLFWKEYIRTHIPDPYPGMGALLSRFRAEGGLVCVVSLSSQENICRDYHTHFGFEPDAVYGWDLPENKRKPSSYALEQIMARFGLTPSQILVVDDMKLACGMARAVGSPIAFAGWGRQGYDTICAQMRQLCDFSFDSVKEFEQFLFSEA